MPKKRKGARIGRTVKGHEQKQGACCPEQAEKRDERTAAAALHGMRAETRSQADPEPTAPEPEPVTEPKPMQGHSAEKDALRQYLAARSLRAVDFGGHGDCLFKVLAEALAEVADERGSAKLPGGTLDERARALRAALVAFVRRRAAWRCHADGDTLAAWVQMTSGKPLAAYCEAMAVSATATRQGCYGDQIMLLAFAWKYGIAVDVLSYANGAVGSEPFEYYGARHPTWLPRTRTRTRTLQSSVSRRTTVTVRPAPPRR
jgi:hypothetical protein